MLCTMISKMISHAVFPRDPCQLYLACQEFFYTRTPPERHIYGLEHRQEINLGMGVQWSGERPSSPEISLNTGKEQRMATIRQPLTGATTRGFPQSGIRFDWMVVLLEAWWVEGVFVDGWAHNHGKVDQSF